MALEPENVIPVIHMARIAALERDTALLDSLVNRVRTLAASGGHTSATARREELEMGTLQAVVHRDSAKLRSLLDTLQQGTGLTLAITTWDVTAFPEDLDAAILLTSALASPNRIPAVRTVGYGWRGLIRLAQGRWNAAMIDLDSAAQFDRGAATAYRAYYSAAPFLANPESLAAIRPSLASIAPPAAPPPADATIHFTAHQGHYQHYRQYLVGLYAALAGDYAQAERAAATLKSMPGNIDQVKLGSNLALGIRAEVALLQGDSAAALAQLEQLDQQISYLLPITTPFYFNARELYRRAQILEGMGRTEDALRWYAGLDALSSLDGIYLVQSLVKRAELCEKLGRRDEARTHYARVLRLMPNPEPMFQATHQKAQAGLQRLSPSR
jgi:tetratricopeptide (TPR) repeat protein